MKLLEDLGFHVETKDGGCTAWQRDRGDFYQEIVADNLPIAPQLLESGALVVTYKRSEEEPIHQKEFPSLQAAINWLTGDKP